MQDRLVINGGSPLLAPPSLPDWPPQDPAIREALVGAFESGSWAYTPGGLQDKLAQEFSQAHGAEHGVFLCNGTTAILGALVALAVGPGDEVVVPAFTCPTTVLPILFLGATPVFVDCDINTLCIAPEKVAEALSPRTKAMVVVHMYTTVADLGELSKISDERGVPIIEDCAHVPGAKWRDAAVGSIGAIGCFSFQARKTMTAGEGGLAITKDKALFDRLHQFVHVGKPYQFSMDSSAKLSFCLSTNASASTFQAAVVLAQFMTLDKLLDGYRRHYALLAERLKTVPGARLQAKDAQLTRQSFFKVCFIFDQPPLSDVPLESILEAAHAEGLPLRRTYGAAYLDLRLRSTMSQRGWGQGSCPIAEEIAMERAAILDHWWLGSGKPGVEFMGQVIERLSALAETIPVTPKPRIKHWFQPRPERAQAMASDSQAT